MMCKRIKRNLICTFLAAFGLFATVLGLSLKSNNLTVSAEVATSSEFTMETGAAIRISEEVQGIRFATYITKNQYDRFVAVAEDNEVQFGTLCMPETFISETNPLEYENLASETNTDGAVNIVAEKWAAGYEPGKNVSTYAFISTLMDVPPTEYLTNLCARSYVKIGDSITYTENTVTRSYAGVALAAHADTSAQKPNDADKSVIYDAYLSGRTFAGLDAKNISYDSSTTALTALDDGKVKVTESGDARAWKNVFYHWNESLEQGETYRIAFDLDIAATTDCDLYIGLVNDNKRLDDAFNSIKYKKLAPGEVSFTYVPATDLETFALIIFSNNEASQGAYQYEYTIDNISVAKMSYVTTGEYALPFTVAPLYTSFKTATNNDMTQNYGAFYYAEAHSSDWYGADFTFDEVKAGKYQFYVKVKNNSATAKNFYIFYHAGAGNKETNIKNVSIAAGATIQYAARVDLSADTTGFMLRMFSTNSDCEFVFGDLDVGNAEIANEGTLGGCFTSFGSVDGAIVSRSVKDSTVYAKNFVGSVTYGTGGASSWRGMTTRINQTFAAGTYTFTFKVTNRTGSEIKMYSKVEGYTTAKTSEHGSLAVGETKTYSVTVTADGTSTSTFIQLNVFSMNANGHSFELGDLKCDYVAS